MKSKTHHKKIIERGPAKYFHGRTEELNSFQDLLKETSEESIGSTVLIQGAPGVGKTALIDQHMKQAKDEKWRVIELDYGCLWNEENLFQALTQKINREEIEKTIGLDVKVFKAEVTHRKSKELSKLNQSIISLKPTLLVLDEVQKLGSLSQEKQDQVSKFLSIYHNLKSKKGFILLLGGLSTSEEVLSQLGVSRSNTEGVYDLKALEAFAERAILHDWLKKEIKAPSDPNLWIDEIVKRTDRWPRHIQSYVNVINYYLKPYEKLRDYRLKEILEEGNRLKEYYYEKRCNGIDYEDRELIAQTLQALAPIFLKRDLIAFFSKDLSETASENLFKKILSKGIISFDSSGKYSVPIPSLRSFLINEYGQPKAGFERPLRGQSH